MNREKRPGNGAFSFAGGRYEAQAAAPHTVRMAGFASLHPPYGWLMV